MVQAGRRVSISSELAEDMSSNELRIECRRCQRELRPTARFCDHCGLSIFPEDTATAILGVSAEASGSSGPPLEGLVIDAKYRIVRQIAAGGMGKVYRARRLHIGDEVVIKLLDKKYVSDEVAAERFRREAQAAARIRHQNVVIIHDFGEANGDDIPAYIVMELVVGVPLKEILQSEGHLSVERVVSLMREICRGVGAGHRSGVIHRDIKPGNIIVTRDDEGLETAKVVDFGLAKIREDSGDPSVTQIGTIVGTPLYMSPEQCRGEALSIRTDIYSLGILTYEMLAGVVPFSGGTSASTCNKHQNEEPPPLPNDMNVPKLLESVVMRALAKDPNERPQDAVEYSRDLQDAFENSRRFTWVGNTSTVEDPPAAVPENRPKLDTKELTILAWSFERAFKRRHNDQIEVEYLVDHANREGMDKDDILRSLASLAKKQLVEVNRNSGPGSQSERYSLKGAAFEEYAGAFIPSYESVKQAVILCLLTGSGNDNLVVAKHTKQPQPIVDQIFNLLSERELITLSKRVGGKLVVKSISSELGTA
jgi:serine/threonine-protein kinase